MVESGRTRQGRVDVIPPPRGIFDIRADSLTPKVLYLASGVDEHGKVNSAFVCVVEKHLSYSYLGDIDKIEEDIGYGTYQTNDFVKTIFWNNSPDLQLDEQAAVDASWAAESIDVAKDLKRFVTSDNVFNLPFDQAVANVNRFTTSPHKIRTLDLAAGVGGNLVYFGLNSDLTVGVELNPDRVSICKNNVNVFGLQNTHVVKQDLFDYIKQFADDPLDKAKEIGVGGIFPPIATI
uniref:Trimethylguanosine synthase n=1 Tax=Babesia bovis TaxID=5865 RepID=S6B6W6_BABBO|nr:hypothetical protein [Babesia bovis]